MNRKAMDKGIIVAGSMIVDNLKNMGCNIIQGYYFDKPLPESEFASRLESPVYEK